MDRSVIIHTAEDIKTLFIQTRRVLFTGKFYYVFGFGLLWIGFFIGIMHFAEDAGVFDANEIFYVLNLVPMIIVALYVSMMLVSFEKDNHTIETMFSVPGSPYKVWSYKLVVMYVLLLFVEIIMAAVSYFFVADFPFQVLVLNIFIPIFFIANLNFFLSAAFKSGYAAGLVTLIFLFINFVLAEPLEHSAWFIYLSPFNRPYNLDELIWNNRLLYNKSSIFGLGLFFMYLGLSKLRNREPFID